MNCAKRLSQTIRTIFAAIWGLDLGSALALGRCDYSGRDSAAPLFDPDPGEAAVDGEDSLD